MSSPRLYTLMQQVCRTVNTSPAATPSDSQLLEQFVRRKDQAAFELLVWRHGPLVLSVCRRVLPDSHAAEDAFQATFLTLVRKAGSIDKGESLSSWLYKVAYRIALRARARASRRAALEQPLNNRETADTGIPPPEQAAWRELRRVLDAEVHRLPEKYRAPFVLCYLEGKTNEQAAVELGCPKGTILSRLARAREKLRERLTLRGLTLSVLPLAAILTDHADALAKMTPVLVNGTVHMSLLLLLGNLGAAEAAAPAVQLMQGMVREMSDGLRKATTVLVVVVLALLFTAGGLWAFHAWSGDPRNGSQEYAPNPSVPSGAPGGCGPPDGCDHGACDHGAGRM